MVCCVVWYGRVGKGRAVEVWSFAVVDLVPEPSRTPRFRVVRSGSGSGSIHERSMKGRNGFRGGARKVWRLYCSAAGWLVTMDNTGLGG